jgi:hypothetical protein
LFKREKYQQKERWETFHISNHPWGICWICYKSNIQHQTLRSDLQEEEEREKSKVERVESKESTTKY